MKSLSNCNTSIDFKTSNTASERLKLLKVNGEVSVSVMSGLIKGSASVDFLDDKRNTNNEESMSLMYRITTQTDQIILNHLKEAIDWEVFAKFKESDVRYQISLNSI